MTAPWADEEHCYITTVGRRTGRPHTVEIWFAASGDTLYVISSATADWVRNIRADPRVRVRVGEDERPGIARVVENPEELALARRLLPAKYRQREDGLGEWAAESQPVAIDIAPGAGPHP